MEYPGPNPHAKPTDVRCSDAVLYVLVGGVTGRIVGNRRPALWLLSRPKTMLAGQHTAAWVVPSPQRT